MIQNLQIHVSDLPRMEEVSYVKHPGRIKTFFLINRIISSIFLLIPAAVFYFTDLPLGAWIAFAVWAFVLVLMVVNIFMEYPRRGYALREHDIIYRKGWLFFSTTVIPFVRIQHTELAEGPLNRMFKLASLKIYTAGGSTSDLRIPGLEYDDAQKLREYIAKKSSENG